MKVRPVRVTADHLAAVDRRLSREAATRIARHAAGSPALAEAYADIEAKDASGNAKIAEARRILSTTLRAALQELGPPLLSALESLILECDMFSVPDVDLADHQLSVMEDAGIARQDMASGRVELLEGWRDSAKKVLGQAIRGVTEAPVDWIDLSTSLFRLERIVRRLLEEHLAQMHGPGWAPECLGDSAEAALALAKSDGYAAASSIEDLQTPLDWLLLNQLLELAALTAQTSGSLGGLSPSDWRRLSSRVVPIRNRVSHMRLPKDGDLVTVRRELRFVETRTNRSR